MTYTIGQPGGPAGPFYSIVRADGHVLAMQIPSKGDAEMMVTAMAQAAAFGIEQHDLLLGAVQMAYRKHHLEDPTIGWDELSDTLLTALCEAMGDEGYQAWLRGIPA